MKRKCCFIPDQSNLADQGNRCQADAEYEIWFGTNPTTDNCTDACPEHLELLFDDSQCFTIVRIEGFASISPAQWMNVELAIRAWNDGKDR